jgi:hypothetical protein
MVPGPGGMVVIKAGQPADEELQQRLDGQCEVPPGSAASRKASGAFANVL